ncbi:MAG TPA: hypoxanthine phosphoribosyltransferase [Kofleriaceae bacterium]|nr:hypoxanthine phosphoribosyltransferase [Kofleriaceae bacterium]
MSNYPLFNRDEDPFKELISADAIAARIAEMGREIAADYGTGKDLVLLAVLKGSVIFLADLVRHVALPLTMDFIGIASYGDETESSGVVQITSDITKPIEDKHVLVVEDIIDTGLTAAYLMKNLATRKPRTVKLCALLHKPSRTEVPVHIDYLGFTIPNEFVVGYGLDIAQRYRNLPFIGYVADVASAATDKKIPQNDVT